MDVLGFDPAYFMYFEEIDLCRRLRERGWQVDFAPVTTIVHEGGASTRQLHAQMQRQLMRSTQLYYARTYSRPVRSLYWGLMTPVYAARVVRDALRFGLARYAPTREQSRNEARAALEISVEMLRDIATMLTHCELPDASKMEQRP
jgi:GT2 family glycosyltransferase